MLRLVKETNPQRIDLPFSVDHLVTTTHPTTDHDKMIVATKREHLTALLLVVRIVPIATDLGTAS